MTYRQELRRSFSRCFGSSGTSGVAVILASELIVDHPTFVRYIIFAFIVSAATWLSYRTGFSEGVKAHRRWTR